MYLMKQRVTAPLARGVEHAYGEVVEVRNGTTVCLLDATMNYLHSLGYDVVGEFEDEQELMEMDRGHAIALGVDGLGPLKALTYEELMALKAEMDEGNNEPVDAAITEAEHAAAPKQAFNPNPNGLTSDDAMRLLGIPKPKPPMPVEPVEEPAETTDEVVQQALETQVEPAQPAEEVHQVVADDSATGDPTE